MSGAHNAVVKDSVGRQLLRVQPVTERWQFRIERRLPRLALVCLFALASTSAVAQTAQDQRPYDDKLLRLSEILGAVHFLRELCGGSDGMLWRDRMVELMDAEASSALRRVRLTRAFNSGYRSYSRTYTSCTATAQGAIAKFMAEGADIADALVKTP